ncbi:hypothetical protein JHK82_053213 [Glycine max]|nr:hypothetical protein JHK86_053059 [Glycine max]KAG4915577.1 hypothetical protein JHK87_053134 [Glycine soja]KAG5083047.1 hypothetical protein JHK84_053085 [Glycine max]KAG5085816.1 hypothetical protein JHK82_053213 [Glycine max]
MTMVMITHQRMTMWGTRRWLLWSMLLMVMAYCLTPLSESCYVKRTIVQIV